MITLFNFLGEDEDGNARYARAMIERVHVYANDGVGSGDVPSDETRVHIFDDTARCAKPFLSHSEWKQLPDDQKRKFWTLSPEGTDYIAIGYAGANGCALPTDCTLYRIVRVGRREIGSARMHHWRVEAR